MKKIIIAALCLIVIAGTAAYILTQPDTSDETIIENDIQVEATVDPETAVDPEPTTETETEPTIEPTSEPTPEPDRTYTQEEANIFFGIVDGSIENTGLVTESDIDAFIDWLDTHLEESETLEQNYIDSLAESAIEEEAVEEAAPVVEEAVAPAVTTPTVTTPAATTPTITETPSTTTPSSEGSTTTYTPSTGSSILGGGVDLSGALEGKTQAEIDAGREAGANMNTDLNLQ